MFGLPDYRLEKRRIPSAFIFEFQDPQTGRAVFVARYDTVDPVEPTGFELFRRRIFESPWFRWLAIPFVLVIIAFGIIAAILGIITPPRTERPRLVLRRSETDESILEIEQSLGMFYDARLVLDGCGWKIARFRGLFKSSLGPMGFGIIDLSQSPEDLKDEGGLPWLGHLAPPIDRVYRFALVGDREAGTITEHRVEVGASPSAPSAATLVDHYEVKVGPGLRDDRVGMTLLLASALALAWRPPAG